MSPSTSAPADTTTLRSTRIFPSIRPLTTTSSSPVTSPTTLIRGPMTVEDADGPGAGAAGVGSGLRSRGTEAEGAGDAGSRGGAGLSGLPKKAKGDLQRERKAV